MAEDQEDLVVRVGLSLLQHVLVIGEVIHVVPGVKEEPLLLLPL